MKSEKYLNALLLVYIYRDIYLNFNKVIEIHAFKYTKRMLLVNHLSEI